MDRRIRESYLAEKLRVERELLSSRDRLESGRRVYCLTRNIAAALSKPHIDALCSSGQDPEILEIGCGTGEAVRTLLKDHPALKPEHIVATALNRLPEHDDLEAMGVRVHTDTLAEDLPDEWSGTFHVVMASVVMQWADVQTAVEEAARVLAPHGVLVGFDTRTTVARVERAATESGMTNLLDQESQRKCWEENGRGLVPFVLQKQ